MHVGVFIDTYYPIVDGVVKVAGAYAAGLAGRCDVTVFTPRCREVPDSYFDRFPYRVVHCKSVMRKGDVYPQGFPDLDPDFKAEVEKSALDIIHIHSAYPMGQFARVFARKHDIPMVGSLHSDFRPDVEEHVGKLIGRGIVKMMMAAYNACDECWAVSKGAEEKFRRDYGLTAPCRLMPFSTDHRPVADRAAARAAVDAEYGFSGSDFVLSHVGRLDLQKREDFIVRVLSRLKNRLPSFKMLFVGGGPKLDYLKQMAGELGVGDNVIFCGAVADLARLEALYARTDLLLFPSVSDIYGLVKIEAACQGTPVLLSGGTLASSCIEDEVNGFVCTGDETAWAERIFALSAQGERLRSVGQGAHRDLYRTWDVLVDDVYENYKRIIENHKKP